jgi:glycerol-3-phosphate dehydrogenase (NAD(P)+)
MRIAFLGAGRWGMALALLLERRGHVIRLWEKDPERRNRLAANRIVPDLPETARIPDSLLPSGDLADVVKDAEVIVLALPTQALRENLRRLRDALTGQPIILSVMKGIEIGTRKRISEIIREFLPRLPIAVLTGPGIPYDTVAGDPTSLVVAASAETTAQIIRDNFSVANLRVYSSNDLVGVELGGALKNVMAVAAGMIDALGLGLNAKSALITRGLYEIIRLGVSAGANPMTFTGLAGVGDLIVTAFSPRSRNYRLGQAIGLGQSVPTCLRRSPVWPKGTTPVRRLTNWPIATASNCRSRANCTESSISLSFPRTALNDCSAGA